MSKKKKYYKEFNKELYISLFFHAYLIKKMAFPSFHR